jgi:hypothetical protein
MDGEVRGGEGSKSRSVSLLPLTPLQPFQVWIFLTSKFGLKIFCLIKYSEILEKRGVGRRPGGLEREQLVENG